MYIDDILITGKTDEDHLNLLEMVLKRMEDLGMLLNKDKCCFMTTSVSYLGYIIDTEGLHHTEEKLQAIRDAPNPKNLTQLKSYLGLLSYYCRFLLNLSNIFFLYLGYSEGRLHGHGPKQKKKGFRTLRNYICHLSY